MRIKVELIDDTWARVRFYDGRNDFYIGTLSVDRGDGLPELIKAAELAKWDIIGVCSDCHLQPIAFEGCCKDCNEMKNTVLADNGVDKLTRDQMPWFRENMK